MSLRIVAVVAALVSALAHLKLWVDGMRDISVIGPAFLVNAVAGVVIAVLLLRRRDWVPAFLVLGFGASTLGALILSSTVGLFGHHEPFEGPYVWTTAVAEVVCIVAGALLLRPVSRRPGA